MSNNILFFCRKNCSYSKKLSLFLRKKAKRIKIISLDINEKPKNLKLLLQKKYNYIFSFRSTYILNQKLIKNTKVAAINFHPGTPKFRGIGCINFAILYDSKFYGVTAHLINKKIDHGKILDVKKFKIQKNTSLTNLLKKTHYQSYLQAKKVMSMLLKNSHNIKIMIKKNLKTTWSDKLYTRNDLNNLYQIDPKIDKIKLKKIIRATNTLKYKPYINFYNFKFELKSN